MKNLKKYDWYCNQCNDLLNNQLGFNVNCGTWSCTNCGEVNYINENEILDDFEINEFENSGFDSYNDFVNDRDSSEGLGVYDAALIWLSHGKDEDYTFGYSEEQLEKALR
jgi:hypothetical protein